MVRILHLSSVNGANRPLLVISEIFCVDHLLEFLVLGVSRDPALPVSVHVVGILTLTSPFPFVILPCIADFLVY